LIKDFDYIKEYEGYVLDRVDLVFLIEMVLFYIVPAAYRCFLGLWNLLSSLFYPSSLLGEVGRIGAVVVLLVSIVAVVIFLFYYYSERLLLVIGVVGSFCEGVSYYHYDFSIFPFSAFLFYLTYIYCGSSKYRNKARLGCVILPIPIINLLSILVCWIIGFSNDEDEENDEFNQKKEGLVFSIYAKVLFFNEKEAKTLNHPEAYGLLYSYYEREGFRRGLIIDRCNEAIGDGVSIVQAASYLKKISFCNDKDAVKFVASLFRFIEPVFRPKKKQNDYTGIEKILSKVAKVFGLTKEEYYCIVKLSAQKLIKLDSEVAAHSEDFLRKVNEGLRKKKKSELYRSTEFGTISNSRQQSLRKVTENVRNKRKNGLYRPTGFRTISNLRQQSEDNSNESGLDEKNLMDEYYAILGCTPNASPKEIQSAYVKIVRETDSPGWGTKDAKERFAKIQEAYQKIKVARGF
jgi:hypothetical protein